MNIGILIMRWENLDEFAILKPQSTNKKGGFMIKLIKSLTERWTLSQSINIDAQENRVLLSCLEHLN